MTITTSRGATYTAAWIATPVQNTQKLTALLLTDQTMAQVAEAFDGLEWVERNDDTLGNKRFDGYKKLVYLAKMEQGVQVSMAKEG